MLIAMLHVNNTPPSQQAQNAIMGNKLSKRTFAGQRASIRAHNNKRIRKAIKSEHLPTVINLNCRSISKKTDELHQLLEDSKADIAVLTETWLTNDNEQITINTIKSNNPDYDVISARRSREEVARGGGVMILVNKRFAPTTTILLTTTTDDNSRGLLEALVGNLLDPILTNAPRCYRAITSDPQSTADHKIINAVALKSEYIKTRPLAQKTRKRAGKITDTVEQIGNINWRQLIASNEHSVQGKFDIFNDNITDILDTCQPWRTAKRKEDKPWMTDELKAEIAKLQRLYFQHKHAKSKTQCCKVANMTRKLKRKAHRKLTATDTDWWQEVNDDSQYNDMPDFNINDKYVTIRKAR